MKLIKPSNFSMDKNKKLNKQKEEELFHIICEYTKLKRCVSKSKTIEPIWYKSELKKIGYETWRFPAFEENETIHVPDNCYSIEINDERVKFKRITVSLNTGKMRPKEGKKLPYRTYKTESGRDARIAECKMEVEKWYEYFCKKQLEKCEKLERIICSNGLDLKQITQEFEENEDSILYFPR